MVAQGTSRSQAAAWRMSAQLILARAVRDNAASIPEAQQDYATTRLAELIVREMTGRPRLRAEQAEAIRAILDGADVNGALAGVVAASPVTSAA